MHTKCISQANYNFSADANQKNKLKPLRRGEKKAFVVCKVGVLDMSFY